MKVFLDGLESKYGGAIGYLNTIGVTEEQMTKICDNFLE